LLDVIGSERKGGFVSCDRFVEAMQASQKIGA
jgi:hypothetical protein